MSAHSHVIARAKERYGLDLTQRDVADLTVAIIDRKQAALACRLPDGSTEEWYVVFQGVRIRVLFQRVDRFIITVLPIQPLRQRRPPNAKGRGRRRLRVYRRGRPESAPDFDEHEAAL